MASTPHHSFSKPLIFQCRSFTFTPPTSYSQRRGISPHSPQLLHRPGHTSPSPSSHFCCNSLVRLRMCFAFPFFTEEYGHILPSSFRDPSSLSAVATHWCDYYIRALRSPFSLPILTNDIYALELQHAPSTGEAVAITPYSQYQRNPTKRLYISERAPQRCTV